jgi:hypothetical protein
VQIIADTVIGGIRFSIVIQQRDDGWHKYDGVEVKSIWLLFLAVVALDGCGPGDGVVGPELGEPFRLNYGQTAVLPDADLSIRFAGVTGDSRCPKDAACFREGDAAIVLHMMGSDYTLHTTLDPKEVVLQHHIIRLIGVSPERKLHKEISIREYSVTLIVTSR